MKSKVYVIDTNVIIRYLLADHKDFFEQARSFMEEVKVGRKKALILESVITECVYVLLKVYKVPKREVAEKLAGILEYKGIVNPDKERLVRALFLFGKENVDIVDAIVFIFGKTGKNMEIFSFDKDFEKLE